MIFPVKCQLEGVHLRAEFQQAGGIRVVYKIRSTIDRIIPSCRRRSAAPPPTFYTSSVRPAGRSRDIFEKNVPPRLPQSPSGSEGQLGRCCLYTPHPSLRVRPSDRTNVRSETSGSFLTSGLWQNPVRLITGQPNYWRILNCTNSFNNVNFPRLLSLPP